MYLESLTTHDRVCYVPDVWEMSCGLYLTWITHRMKILAWQRLERASYMLLCHVSSSSNSSRYVNTRAHNWCVTPYNVSSLQGDLDAAASAAHC